MPIRRRKKNEAPSEIDQIKDLTVDVEGVKHAIETCIDFEQATKIHLIDQNGRIEFSKLYKRKEKENRVREMVIDEVKKQLSPLDSKLSQLLRISADKEQADRNSAIKKRVPTDDELNALNYETKTY